MAVLLFVDGVLRNSQRAPIRTGMLLYHSLKEKNRVLLLCPDKDKDDNWLRQQKINNYDDLVDLKSIPAPGDFPELRQVEHLNSQGPVDFVITTDPSLTAKLLAKGITTVFFASPLYIAESFRPDSKEGVKAWDEIVKEIIKQQDVFREDPRIQ
jgi:hypothetical protein